MSFDVNKFSTEYEHFINSAQKKVKRDSLFDDFCLEYTYIGILSLLGNIYNLSRFCFKHKHLSPVETFYIHQTIVDLLCTLLSYPLPIIASVNHEWIFGEIGKYEAFYVPQII